MITPILNVAVPIEIDESGGEGQTAWPLDPGAVLLALPCFEHAKRAVEEEDLLCAEIHVFSEVYRLLIRV